MRVRNRVALCLACAFAVALAAVVAFAVVRLAAVVTFFTSFLAVATALVSTFFAVARGLNLPFAASFSDAPGVKRTTLRAGILTF